MPFIPSHGIIRAGWTAENPSNIACTSLCCQYTFCVIICNNAAHRMDGILGFVSLYLVIHFFITLRIERSAYYLRNLIRSTSTKRRSGMYICMYNPATSGFTWTYCSQRSSRCQYILKIPAFVNRSHTQARLTHLLTDVVVDQIVFFTITYFDI